MFQRSGVLTRPCRKKFHTASTTCRGSPCFWPFFRVSIAQQNCFRTDVDKVVACSFQTDGCGEVRGKVVLPNVQCGEIHCGDIETPVRHFQTISYPHCQNQVVSKVCIIQARAYNHQPFSCRVVSVTEDPGKDGRLGGSREAGRKCVVMNAGDDTR